MTKHASSSVLVFLKNDLVFFLLEVRRNVEAAFSVYLANVRYNPHKTMIFADRVFKSSNLLSQLLQITIYLNKPSP